MRNFDASAARFADTLLIREAIMQSFSSFPRWALGVPALLATLALVIPGPVLAQDDGVGPDPGNASDSVAAAGIGVARVSFLSGDVAMQRGDSTDSLAAALNAPVLGGDYLTTGDGARAEIQFDGRARVRVGSAAQLRFTHIDSDQRTLQLAAGTIELRLLQSTSGANEIDTPSIAVKARAHGAYRVTVDANGQTAVTVRSGSASIETPQGEQDLAAGSTLLADGPAGDPNVQTVAAIDRDDFDAFNADRDRLQSQALPDPALANANISGLDDLAANGRWVSDGSYGQVWVPAAVGPDWAPYRDGRWVWEDGYGWTWVAAEPWGWAPYHYGSWYHSPAYGWCWYPPQPQVVVPWRPALVAFIGFGAGAGFSLGFGGGTGFGSIGWVPLAPFEPYHPWWGSRYGSNTTIINNVTNVTNVTNITNVTVYKNVQYNAVSSVTSQRFLQGNFQHNTPVAAAQLQHAQVFTSALPVVPTASNLRFSAAAAPPVTVRRAFTQQPFAGAGGVVQRTAFTQQRVALARITHAPITPLHFRDAETTPLIAPRALAPANAPAAPARTTATSPWERFSTSRSAEPNRIAHPSAVPAASHADTPTTTFDEVTAGRPARRPAAETRRVPPAERATTPGERATSPAERTAPSPAATEHRPKAESERSKAAEKADRDHVRPPR